MAFKKSSKKLPKQKSTMLLSVKRQASTLVSSEEDAPPEDELLNQEFYPELLAVIVNFLSTHKKSFIKGNKEVLDTFTDIASQATFHISKECALQFLLEDAGIYAEREHLDFEEAFEFLQMVLNGLYWDQMNQCLPLQARRTDCGYDEDQQSQQEELAKSLVKVENHPDMFHDHVAMYSYLPNILLNSLWNDSRTGEATCSLQFEGVCMLADISGFTKLSGMCCEEGTGGLDRLHSACSGYLGKFVQTVYSFRGDVISFAGDAIIVVFPLDPNDRHDSFVEEGAAKKYQMSICCQRAVECGKILAGFYTNELTAHVGISYGEMSMAKLGGYNDQWVYLLNGACINAISSCVDNATSKEVVVTETVFNNLFSTSADHTSGKGRAQKDFVRDDGAETYEITVGDRYMTVAAVVLTSGNVRIEDFTSVVGDMESLEAPLISRFAGFCTPDLQLQCTSEILSDLLVPSPAPEQERNRVNEVAFDNMAKLFVPKPVLDAISFSTLETVSELREVTTMFMNLNSYDPVKNRDPLTLQTFAYMAQEVLAKTGGFMRQFLIDDKGCVLIAMWGVPSFSYSNNMERATACSILLRTGTIGLGHTCSIGITSGTVYVGNIGSLVRRDFVGLGADVNLAARFMSKAKGSIYIDQKAAAQLPEQFRNSLPLSHGLVLKGVKGLSHACICAGDMDDFVFSDFVESVCKRRIDVGAEGDVNEKVLLPKSVSDPIKSRLRKNQRRHAFLSKQKQETTDAPDAPEASSSHAPALGAMKIAKSKYSSMLISKRGLASVRGLSTDDRGASPGAVMTPQQMAKTRAKEAVHKPHPVNFIVCEGTVGTGKTMTVNFFTEFAQRCDMNVASYACVSGDVSLPLGVINRIVMMILGDSIDRLPWLAARMHWDTHDDDPLQLKTALLRRALGVSAMGKRTTTLANFKHNVDEDNVSFMGHESFNPDDNNLFSVLGEDKDNTTTNKSMCSVTSDGFEVRQDRLDSSVSESTSVPVVAAKLDSDMSAPASTEYGSAGMSAQPSGSDGAVRAMMQRFTPRLETRVLPEELEAASAAKYKDDDEADENLPTHSDNEGIIFHLLFVLLNEDLFAVVIDNAQYCDESSWNVLLMVSHLLANSVVMLALRAFHVGHTHSLETGAGEGVALPSNMGSLGDEMNQQVGQSLTLKPQPAKGTGPSAIDGVAKHNPLAWSDFHGNMPASCALLLANPFTVHLELKPFTLDEVRLYMLKTLDSHELVRDLQEELVVSVHEVSSGCPFWVRQIVTFINTRGEKIFLSDGDSDEPPPSVAPQNAKPAPVQAFSVKNFLTGSSGKTTEPSPNTPVVKKKKNPLHQMIIVRLESMTPEEQTILKHASIIGENFNATLLSSVLPVSMQEHLSSSLPALVQVSLIFPDDADSDVYSFANHLIHKIIYDLTPPSEANKLHRSIASGIEKLYLPVAKKSTNARDLAECYRM